MKKDKRLIRKIGITAAIIAGFVAFLSGILFAVSSFYEDLESTKRKLEGQNASLIAETETLLDKKNKATSSMELYQAIRKKNRSEDFNIDREVGATIFKDLRDRYRLKLSGENSFSQISDVQEEGFKKDSGVVVASNARLGFESVTDEMVYNFINDLSTTMPGFVFINSLSITKRNKIDGAALSQLGRGEFPSLVSTNLNFMWVGLKAKTQEQIDKDNAAKGLRDE
jgi:hypothetical protein